MKALVVFGSTTGHTRSMAERMRTMLRFACDIVDVKQLTSAFPFRRYGLLIFMASTWGDQELQADMERFLVHEKWDLDGKPYAVCELGNYFGYDDFDFGAGCIMRHQLENWGGREFMEQASIDSFTRNDWHTLGRWCDELNQRITDSNA